MYNAGSLLGNVGRYADRGANFIWGTGSNIVGDEIRAAVKNRKATGDSFVRSMRNGLSNGFKKDAQRLEGQGFFKTTWNTLRAIPSEMATEFKSAKGLKKLYKVFSPLKKAFPFLMNAMWVASSIPNIVDRCKDEGFFGGIKETTKTLFKMASFALGSALGAAFGGVGCFVGGMALSVVAEKIAGEGHKDKKDRLAFEAEQKAQQEAQELSGDMKALDEQVLMAQNSGGGSSTNPFANVKTT